MLDLDLEKIAKDNPLVDLAQVREALELAAELDALGVEPRGYEIKSPYDRRPLPRMC